MYRLFLTRGWLVVYSPLNVFFLIGMIGCAVFFLIERRDSLLGLIGLIPPTPPRERGAQWSRRRDFIILAAFLSSFLPSARNAIPARVRSKDHVGMILDRWVAGVKTSWNEGGEEFFIRKHHLVRFLPTPYPPLGLSPRGDI